MVVKIVEKEIGKEEFDSWEKFLMGAGMVCNVFGGIQIDVVSVKIKHPDGTVTESTLCDHNCVEDVDGIPTGGKYSCPAAYSINKGIMLNTLAPADKIINGVKRTASAIENSKGYFLGEKFFGDYSREFNIPGSVGQVMKEVLWKGGIEVNLFGGNPEMHPEIVKTIDGLRKEKYSVSLTTTGRRLLTENFVKELFSNPPNILALSLDDVESVKQLCSLSSLSLEEIRQEWKKVPPTFGQRQKAYEAIYSAKLVSERFPSSENKPRVMFNMVVHRGNLQDIYKFMDALNEYFPDTMVNPFPAQSSFLYGSPIFKESDLSLLEGFVDYMIEEQLEQSKRQKDKIFIPRLHYWLMLKSAFETYSKNNPELLQAALSGYNIWKCYRRPGAGRYVQIGTSSVPNNDQFAGGHLGCFWNNKTVTEDRRQVWDMEVGDIEHYIKGDMVNIAKESAYPCPGCIMPRLNFDLMGVETGMHPQLIPAYLEIRKQHVGF
jgi:hypothetical protein